MKKAIVSSIPIRQGVRYSEVKTKKSLTRPTAIPISPLKRKMSKIPVTTPVKASNLTKNRTVKGVKIPTPVSAKRKNEDATTGRNVRKRLVDNHDDHNVVLSESRLENAVLIADNTSLELEEERLKKEYNAKFAEIFQLEHVLACEQSDAAQLFDSLENKRSEYFLLVKEKDDLIKSQAMFEELNSDAEKKLDELDKLLFTCDAQLKDITKLFEEKVQANAVLRLTVDELKKKKKNRRYKK
ncbi:hypothetical protein RhiirA5_363549 [Rhizophagus irregularis]|uniref:Uncharacterized protein n=4 Tax=Rhizophagus irregularis TaxID=588596 RepID=U9TT48_RHIID|nr:hypothetical protein GLOIN_2v1627615 [Rhizophagus irregularis DAOM 181602=DAOM 197198]EXX73183.1 hypothetical protein RirG_062430 [Rhizophagus irregularis DAOM 197198w]PKC03093.1 hypothetical protein RhiirA5_363549 [Rhizophagus irregularis]PKC60643.1 hypothetical protein RhiirA1_425683 [Rhizophagus irregularis]PKY20380.1 hypothetical protein RhiirB3_408182 [Rhizophagus irregularis]PKY45536.1 hypothetical protein RhiirA4_401335 [Rhizophagus irregularis]|eukprot:XP_025176295.1 hypothetical protein GLOIN_2v1627615 [Rhizophagus irregularis DAOM 181602=DAOM 197198]